MDVVAVRQEEVGGRHVSEPHVLQPRGYDCLPHNGALALHHQARGHPVLDQGLGLLIIPGPDLLLTTLIHLHIISLLTVSLSVIL